MAEHPILYLVEIRCSCCGESFSTHSTAEAIVVEVCSNCHPAYNGREHAVASGDRIERFYRRRAFAAAA